MRARLLCISILFSTVNSLYAGAGWIRINQLGYLPESVKVAVFISEENITIRQFQLRNAVTDEVVYTGQTKEYDASVWAMKSAFRLDFSKFQDAGGYYIQLGQIKSPCFRIANDVYEGTADFILNYMRQQRCGYNPYLKDSCHLNDGIIVDHPSKTGQEIDVTGGWHDASDYLQYLATSANATYQMLFAWLHNPDAYGDKYDSIGNKGENGVPDILDEAGWGLKWLDKMNPAYEQMYNQIADDRDHAGFRLPNKDSANYGLGKHRPVYFITGKPQGLAEYKNRTTGVSSSAAKFASAFALGAKIFREYDPAFAEKIAAKAAEAYEFALTDLGACQTACNVSPYFYEEENYVDDMELAACELHRLTNKKYYLEQAANWGAVEPVTPWMSSGRARHYQFYPFVNLGHYYLARKQNTYADYLKDGLQFIYDRGEKDPFLNGIPFIWCSNNLVAAALTQAGCYYNATKDPAYLEMEAALRDWLFGCNPWGTSMICGLPAGGDYPESPHSSITWLLHETTVGGLIDGPVDRSIYENLRGIHLMEKDEYAAFQNGKAVYHDDMGDYSTNEPTMDGTASLSFYLSSLEKQGNANRPKHVTDEYGAIVRMDPAGKDIYLAFTADKEVEGGQYILQVLNDNRIKASFFFTGNLLRNPDNNSFVKRTIDDGHYVGPHSDGHLLYCDWKKRDELLLDRQKFEDDLKKNYTELRNFGVSHSSSRWFMPPYEWYNGAIVGWARAMGVYVVNFTAGTGTNADYTTPGTPNYISSDDILKSLYRFEKEDSHGLNGCVILIHPGTDSARNDKFYRRLPEIIVRLKNMGYNFKRL